MADPRAILSLTNDQSLMTSSDDDSDDDTKSHNSSTTRTSSDSDNDDDDNDNGRSGNNNAASISLDQKPASTSSSNKKKVKANPKMVLTVAGGKTLRSSASTSSSSTSSDDNDDDSSDDSDSSDEDSVAAVPVDDDEEQDIVTASAIVQSDENKRPIQSASSTSKVTQKTNVTTSTLKSPQKSTTLKLNIRLGANSANKSKQKNQGGNITSTATTTTTTITTTSNKNDKPKKSEEKQKTSQEQQAPSQKPVTKKRGLPLSQSRKKKRKSKGLPISKAKTTTNEDLNTPTPSTTTTNEEVVQATIIATDDEDDDEDSNQNKSSADGVTNNTKDAETSSLVVQAVPLNDTSMSTTTTTTATSSSSNAAVSTTTTSTNPKKLKPFSSIKQRPSLATPSVVSEKRILLHAGPAENLPPGWTIKHYKRTTGLKHTDRYWFSPLLKKKFRSLAQVGRFLDFLAREAVFGDETKAWELFRTSPPGPDEIRSNRNLASGTGASGSSTVVGVGGSLGGGGGSSKKKHHDSANGFLPGGMNGAGSHGLLANGIGMGYGSSATNSGHSMHGGGAGGYSVRAFRFTPIPSPGLFMVPPPSLKEKCNGNSSSSASNDSPSTTTIKEPLTSTSTSTESTSKAVVTPEESSSSTSNNTTLTKSTTLEKSNKFSQIPKLKINDQGFTSPSSVFETSLHMLGYSKERLNKARQKRSSFPRGVGDMFDSNVHLDEIELIPNDLWCRTMLVDDEGNVLPVEEKKEKDGSVVTNDQSTSVTSNTEDNPIQNENVQSDNNPSTTDDGDKSKRKRMLSQVVMDKLSKHIEKRRKISKQTTSHLSSRPSLAAPSFETMIPRSLTTPLPDSYVQKRKVFYKQVKDREDVVRKAHEQKQEFEKALDAYEDAKEEWLDKKESLQKKDSSKEEQEAKIGPKPTRPTLKDPIEIPDIPYPSFPSIEESKSCKNNYTSTHEVRTIPKGKESGEITNSSKTNEDDTACIPCIPTCIPDNKKYLVAHLDPDSFLIPEGRYYGLLSNQFADPQFVGPNAPGITGISTNVNTALSTAIGGGMTSTSSNFAEKYTSAASGNDTDRKSTLNSKNGNMASSSSNTSGKADKAANSSGNNKNSKVKKHGPDPSATSTPMQLKKLMEKGGHTADAMRNSIIRAAVYSSRTGRHGGPFVGADGETYPDVSKAFSNHGNLRPCGRCKNNKQGAYHCRLKRKHKDQDFDGGNSADVLIPLFEIESLEKLIEQK